MSYADPTTSTGYSTRTWIIFMIGVFFAITACGLFVYIGYDVSCHNDANTWLPDYPDAEFVSEEYTFFRAWGIGETNRTLYSPDPVVTVRQWYINNNIRLADETGQRSDNSLALLRYFVRESEDREGSTIVLYSECASDIIPW